jgi:hypothetical protein
MPQGKCVCFHIKRGACCLTSFGSACGLGFSGTKVLIYPQKKNTEFAYNLPFFQPKKLLVNTLRYLCNMAILKRIFDFYLRGSIHVALAVCALILMTQHMFRIPIDPVMALFGFFGTITGYNFVKYDELARVRRKNVRGEVKAYALLSFVCFIGAIVCFIQFRLVTQLVSVSVLLLTALYTLPFFPNRSNARNWSGVKIYIVSLCWVGVTVVLPLLDAGVSLSADFWIKCVQRFILIFVLILIFEIVDLAKDDPHLHTVPQQIGVAKTKWLGFFLMFIFLGLEFLLSQSDIVQLLVNMIIATIAVGFLSLANPGRSRYYSAFWVESIPIVWWLLVVLSERLPQFSPLFRPSS